MTKIEMTEYEGPDTHLLPADYESAFATQSACNLSGIARWFSDVTATIWKEARARGKGTDWVNQHPICRLMAEQMAYLSGAGPCSGSLSYHTASEYCYERAKVKVAA